MKMQLSCGCCDVPSVLVGVLRPLNGGGPLNGDVSVSGYVDEWEVCPLPATGELTDYWLPMKASNLTSFSPGTPVILNAWYELKSKPFRYVLAASESDPIGGIVCDYAIGYENRSTGPDAGNHLSPLMASAVSIRPPVSGCGWAGAWAGVTGGAGSTNTIDITHGRVMIDGVDASGVVALPGGSNATIPLTSPRDMTNAAVSVDLWYRVTVFIPGSLDAFNPAIEFVPGTNTPAYLAGAMITCDRNHIFPNEFNTNPSSPWYRSLANPFFAQASYGSTDVGRWVNLSRYTLTFDRQGPGGVESLQLRAQSGWTLSVTAGTTIMTHVASSDFVVVQIGREVPRIQIFKHGSDTTGAVRRCNYSPRGADRYQSFLVGHSSFGVYATAPRSDWQKNGTTVFGNDGRVVGVGSFTSPQTWYPPESGIPSGVDFYSEFPLEIQMVKS